MKKSYLKIGIPAFIFFLADQLLKVWAAGYLTVPIQITPWAGLVYRQNAGIAWSIAIPQPWLSILNILLLVVLPLFISRHIDLRRKDAQFFLSMVIGGALGNLFDRIARGFVIDYVAIGNWPVFNLADALLTIGIFLILLFYAKIKRT